jgi:hypothetical protein
MNPRYEQIINTSLPAFRANIRHHPEYRKGWAREVKNLLKSLNLGWISVTAPHYSMAMSIDINFKQSEPFQGSEHEQKHREIDEAERANSVWMGYVQYCPHCRQEHEAHEQLEKIILSAFPDLNDRGDPVTDYSDYCLSIS